MSIIHTLPDKINPEFITGQGRGQERFTTSGRSLSPCSAPSRRPQYNSVAIAYSDWLKQYDDMWSWYGHFTFRHGTTKHGSIHPERADKLFNHFRDKLNIEIFGRNYKKKSDKGVFIARSTEIGEKGGLLHYHTLWGRVPSDVQRVEWKEIWNGLAGFARIYEYDRKQGGAAYLSKSAYAWKRGEIDFIGPWEHVKSVMTESYCTPEMFAHGANQ